jgi:two-component system cell cycle response regulator DivK
MNQNSKKILIVDDDLRNIFALLAVLRSRGYTCLSATGAIEGIHILEQDREIGIVLLDMMMPGMDGYEAISVIRRKPAISAVIVIALTAQAMPGDKEKCLAAGANHYISKPVELDDLVNLLKDNMN